VRRISFSMTKDAYLNGTKTVTRRLGWKTLKPGDRLMGVEKAMGLKKGEKCVPLGALEVVSVRREPLDTIGPDDVIAEGFPHMTCADFVRFFAAGHGCAPNVEVTRIEFRKLAAASESDPSPLVVLAGANEPPPRPERAVMFACGSDGCSMSLSCRFCGRGLGSPRSLKRHEKSCENRIDRRRMACT
jgi:hypothetical protein